MTDIFNMIVNQQPPTQTHRHTRVVHALGRVVLFAVPQAEEPEQKLAVRGGGENVHATRGTHSSRGAQIERSTRRSDQDYPPRLGSSQYAQLNTASNAAKDAHRARRMRRVEAAAP